jgi:hypothetical protein
MGAPSASFLLHFVFFARKTHTNREKQPPVGESRPYLKDSENKCSMLFPLGASFGMIHVASLRQCAVTHARPYYIDRRRKNNRRKTPGKEEEHVTPARAILPQDGNTKF